MEVYGLGGGSKVGKSTISETLRAQVEATEDLEFSDPIRWVANRWLERLPEISKTADKNELIDIANSWIQHLPAPVKEVTGYKTKAEHFEIDGKDHEAYQDMHGKLIEYLTKRATGEVEGTVERDDTFAHVEILQWLGYSTREFIDQDIWGNTMRGLLEEARDNFAELVTVGGVRFEQDAQFVRSVGGLVVRLYRPEVEDLHDYANEAAAYTWEADIDIVNNGTLEQLEQAALEVRNYQPGTSGVTIKTSEL